MLFKRISLLVLLMCGGFSSYAQYFLFSESKETFPTEVINSLNRIDTESARKVASDFRSVWENDLSEGQKDQIIEIAKVMKKRQFQLRPYFEYYFSYITYSIKQSGISADQLSTVLDITQDAASNTSRREYSKFLLTLNLYFAREYLYYSKFNYTKAIGGTYQFEVLGEPDPTAFNEPVEEVVEEEPIEDEWVDENDTSWLDEEDDSWPDDDASWVDDDSAWGEDDWDDGSSWDEEPAAPERLEIVSTARDYVGELLAKFNPPPVTGAVLKLDKTDILMVTPYDSMRIKGTSGTYELKGRTFLGKGGEANWPGELKQMRAAKVTFEDYFFNVGKAEIWTPYAKLNFPQFLNKEVEGVFKFRSVPVRKNKTAEKRYPYFESMQADIEVDIPFEGVSYTGGIAFHGQKMYGRAISRNLGTLTIRDGKGRSITAKSQEFAFVDSLITSDDALVYIVHRNDTIYHPSVSMRYDPEKKLLKLSNSDTDFKNAPYYSTFHLMELYTDQLTWDMNTDSLDMSIRSARDLTPALLISEDYFSPEVFRRFGVGLDFHPVIVAVNYAKKYGITEFNIDELGVEYKIDQARLNETAKILKREGFAEYDPITRVLKLKEKAFHSWEANFKKRDYDHLLISSVLNSAPNATIHLEDDELIVRGVKEFYLSADKDLLIRPDSGVIKLQSNRNVKFDGMVNAGDFQYRGKEFEFDYEQFLVNMPTIDSIRIQIAEIDSTDTGNSTRKPEKKALHNHINQTSGVLYLNDPSNKSGKKEKLSYPHFTSDSEAVVYFDSPDYLDGAYDRSIRFIVPPFEMDSVNREDSRSIKFKGRFESGGLFPTFEDELIIMPDKTLGFEHEVPPEGYVLYETGAKIYNNIKLDGEGIHSSGQLDYITTSVHSDDFTFYPDSVSAVGDRGVIKEGNKFGASYPSAELGKFKMLWRPRKDSMYIRNIDEPFKFYNRTATLDGEANVTKKGVFGSGTMLTRGSRSNSKNLSFKQFSYSARNADFEVLSDNPNKPAMSGDDISLEFDLLSNTADITPERAGVASLSFPYAQIKTSLSEAFWDLEDSVVTMLKSPGVAIEDSYFYSTKPELDSLAFSAEQASYDINTFELQIAGIPFIKVADAKITPENGETTILKDSELLPFMNAEIVIDTLNEYHYLFDGNIKISSSKSFEGDATYKLVNAESDTFDIKFRSFELTDVPIGKKKTQQMTVSGGEITDQDKVAVSAGFIYKGSVTMYAFKEPLELKGLVRLETTSFGNDYNKWIQYERDGEENVVAIDFESALYEDGQPVNAGLHYDIRGRLYPSLLGDRRDISDIDIFTPTGTLRYDLDNQAYQIESPAKTAGESYEGATFIYDDKTQDVIFEGLMNFSKNTDKGFGMITSVLGTGNAKEEVYNMDVMTLLDFGVHSSIPQIMATDLSDLIETVGLATAHDNSIQTLYKLANIIGDEAAKDYENAALRNYQPLVSSGRGAMESTIGVSNVKMSWSAQHKKWYNTTKIGLSHIENYDINAKMNGFIEFGKSDSEQDVIHLFFQPSAGTWYYFGYEDHHLFMLSSNEDFNAAVEERSNNGKAKAGELITLAAEVTEVEAFINRFRLDYQGITEPYDLQLPADIQLEDDEEFDTVETDEEEEDDDGFGF